MHLNVILRTNASLSGTFWYHAHLGSEYSMGLHGPLIVLNPNKEAENNERVSGTVHGNHHIVPLFHFYQISALIVHFLSYPIWVFSLTVLNDINRTAFQSCILYIIPFDMQS